MKKCYFCRREIIKKKVQHIHYWGNKIVLFKDIPAEVCKQCGEIYFEPDVIEIIDKTMLNTDKIEKIVEVPVIPFPELTKV